MGNARQAVLLRALDILGNRERLCRAIGGRPVVLDGWLGGEVPIPEAAFLKAVDIIQMEAINATMSGFSEVKRAA